jgi:hypothetical protein
VTLGFYTQIFGKNSDIKFHQNTSSGIRDIPHEQTDRHDEANSRFSLFCERSKLTPPTLTVKTIWYYALNKQEKITFLANKYGIFFYQLLQYMNCKWFKIHTLRQWPRSSWSITFLSSSIISYICRFLFFFGYSWQLYIIGHYFHRPLVTNKRNNLAGSKSIYTCRQVSYLIWHHTSLPFPLVLKLSTAIPCYNSRLSQFLQSE